MEMAVCGIPDMAAGIDGDRDTVEGAEGTTLIAHVPPKRCLPLVRDFVSHRTQCAPVGRKQRKDAAANRAANKDGEHMIPRLASARVRHRADVDRVTLIITGETVGADAGRAGGCRPGPTCAGVVAAILDCAAVRRAIG